MEQCTFKNVIFWNTNISFYLYTSGGQNFNLYLNVAHFSTPVLIRHLLQPKTGVFLHRCLLRVFYYNENQKSLTLILKKLGPVKIIGSPPFAFMPPSQVMDITVVCIPFLWLVL